MDQPKLVITEKIRQSFLAQFSCAHKYTVSLEYDQELRVGLPSTYVDKLQINLLIACLIST